LGRLGEHLGGGARCAGALRWRVRLGARGKRALGSIRDKPDNVEFAERAQKNAARVCNISCLGDVLCQEKKMHGMV